MKSFKPKKLCQMETWHRHEEMKNTENGIHLVKYKIYFFIINKFVFKDN